MRKRLALVAACCVVALAGCSDADETEPDGPGAEQSADQVDRVDSDPEDQTTAPSTSDSTDTVDEQADPAPTGQDFVSREEWAGYSWQGEGDPPPLPPVIRTVSPEEQLQAIAGCLIDTGFPVELDADTGVLFSGELPDSQWQAYQEAHYICYASYPWEPKYYQPYTDEQLLAWYEHLAGDTIACLNDLGYTGIDSPPSAEAWIEGYRTGRGTGWSPFGAVPDQDRDRIIATSCPLQPEGFFDMAATG